MKIFFWAFLLFSTSVCEQVHADAATPFENHHWYMYVSSGVSRPSYDAEFSSMIEQEKAKGEISPFAGMMDFPVIYYKPTSGLLVGPFVTAVFESVSRAFREGNSLSFYAFNAGASGQYYFDGTIGRGFFVRGDLGASRLYRVIQQNNGAFEEEQFNGSFVKIGTGYGWKVYERGSLLTHLDFFNQAYSSHYIRGLAWNVGFIF